MQVFTQKYTIVCFVDALPLNYDFSMDSWPPHVTLADVFAIDTEPLRLIEHLDKRLDSHSMLNAKTISEEWFGEKKTIRVGLIEKTNDLLGLHEEILNVLERHGVVFNNPEYTHQGFLPHITIEADTVFEPGTIIKFDSISLVDMFPDEDPYHRKVLGTINFRKF